MTCVAVEPQKHQYFIKNTIKHFKLHEGEMLLLEQTFLFVVNPHTICTASWLFEADYKYVICFNIDELVLLKKLN